MKIVLINPRSKIVLTFYRRLSLHIGLLYLYAVLKPDYDVNLVDMNFTDKTIKQIIHEEKPNVIGISCYSNCRHAVFEMCQKIRNIDKDIKIVLGGYHATFLYKQILENYDLDYIIVGEGETVFKRLIDQLNKGIKIKKLGGVAFKEGGKVTFYPPRTNLMDINKLPILDYAPYIRYLRQLRDKEMLVPVLSFSRGCPYSCFFCNKYIIQGYSRLSLENACNSVDHMISSLPSSRIIISDNNFFLKPRDKYLQSICSHIERSKQDVRLTVLGRADNLDKDNVRSLKKAGTDLIFIGAESGSEKVLGLNQKNLKIRQVITAFSTIKKNNISSAAYFIMGLPGESLKSLKETERFIMRANPTHLVMRKCVLNPGSRLYDHCIKTGKFKEADWLKGDPYFLYKGDVPFSVQSYYILKIKFKHAIKNRLYPPKTDYRPFNSHKQTLEGL